MTVPQKVWEEILANMARQRLEASIKLLQAGKFTIELVRAPDDPGEGTAEFQEELRHFEQSLNNAGISYSQMWMAQDSVEAQCFPLPEYVMVIMHLGPPVILGLAHCAATWVTARNGRKVRLRVGNVEAEGSEVAEIKALFETAATFQDRKEAPESEKDSDPSG